MVSAMNEKNTGGLDLGRAKAFVEQVWSDSIVPRLVEYVAIPNKSPMFDPDWVANGYMDDAIDLAQAWCVANLPKGAQLQVVRLEGRTPLLFIDVPGDAPGTVVMYGHLDKQPEMTGWADGLGPWTPVIKDGKLYGRGGADDGYAVFASVTAINTLQAQGVPHARCVLLIECCEESGSYDLPYYVDHLAERIGDPDLVICLDSGCGNYDQLWSTTNLRGMVGGTLSVGVLDEGVHSGDASGVVPSSFRVARQLIDRIEDAKTGAILLDALKAEIPPQRIEQARFAAEVLGKTIYERFPFTGAMEPTTHDLTELILRRTWRPALSVTGVGGLPSLDNAGNVLRPGTQLKLSMRLPPTVEAAVAEAALTEALTANPPYNATVHFDSEGASGWNAPAVAPWLDAALNAASSGWFGPPAAHMGEGGTIPFMGMLGEKFPKAQFVITGVLGPKSNAHGPNEFLHLATARKLTGCMAQVLAIHGGRGA